MTDWVRLWHDMPTDPKWRAIAKRCGRPITDVLAVFVFMLTNASANATERGVLINWQDDDIAAALDIDTEHVAAIRDAMQGKTLDGDKLTGWEKRQPKREDSSAERAKTWRERNRTQPNAEKRPDTDTDTDISSLRSDIGAGTRPRADEPPIEHRPAMEKTRGERAARLPDGWAPQPEDWNAAISALECQRAESELAKFRDYWKSQPGSRGRKLDWSATWRNWVRSAGERLPRARAGPRTSANPYLAIAADLGAFDVDRDHNPPSSHDLRPAAPRYGQPDPPVSEPTGMDPGCSRSLDLIALRA